jgi:hypothetical protein
VLYDFKVGDPKTFYRQATFPNETPVHDALRRQETALRQIKTFFDEGRIVQTCSGPCDPD